jgi:serine/threonine protein kinase
MGEVYRAKDTRLDRTVAMKILPAHLSSDPVRKQRFEREAKIISSLNHPNICVLYDVGQDRGGLTCRPLGRGRMEPGRRDRLRLSNRFIPRACLRRCSRSDHCS